MNQLFKKKLVLIVFNCLPATLQFTPRAQIRVDHNFSVSTGPNKPPLPLTDPFPLSPSCRVLPCPSLKGITGLKRARTLSQ